MLVLDGWSLINRHICNLNVSYVICPLSFPAAGCKWEATRARSWWNLLESRFEHIAPCLETLPTASFGGEDRKNKCVNSVMFWKIPSLCLADTNQLSNAHVSKTPRSKQQLPPTNSSAATLASPLHLHLRSLRQRRCQQKDCHFKKPDGTYPDVTKIWHGLMYPSWYIEPLAKIAKTTKLHMLSYSHHHVVHLETKSWSYKINHKK